MYEGGSGKSLRNDGSDETAYRSGDIFSLFNPDLVLIDGSSALMQAYPAARQTGTRLETIYPELATAKALKALRHVADGGKPRSLSLKDADGGERVLSLFRSSDGLVILETRIRPRSADAVDINEHARLLHQATHDALTGLPNRRQFGEDLTRALLRVRQSGGSIALMQLDLDDFKPVNDTLGHGAGDMLLQLASARIREHLGSGEIVYRLAGDEFAIILEREHHPARAQWLGEALALAFKNPFTVNGIALFVGASVGIAVAPRDGSNSEELMKAADVALYAAKKDGRGRSSIFDTHMLQVLEQRELLRRSLRTAIEKQQFFVEYQPLTEKTGIVGFEALLRWHHPLLGLIPPSVFIPMAEADGLMSEIGQWMLEQACSEALNWPDHYTVAVNLSPAEFLVDGLTDRISKTLDLTGLPAERLELEITETVLLERTINNLDTLNTLKVLGIRIALDDFGTEYSSLSYLKTFPFDSIKIDKYFISDLEKDCKSQTIARFVIGLAHGLGMRVTAEGVETAAQATWLEAEGCDRLQGFLISKPIGAGRLADFINTWNDSLYQSLQEKMESGFPAKTNVNT